MRPATDNPATREAIRDLVEKKLGHRLETRAGRGLERVLRRAASTSGQPDEETYTAALLSRPGDTALLEALLTELCIGETYFFREPEIYRAITSTLLPAHSFPPAGRAFRAWSAGCATGEEIYSLAITLARSAFRNCPLDLMASDINPDFLRRAEAGVFRPWSFRSPPPWLLPTFFEAGPKEAHRLRRELCAPVNFFRLNLAEDTFPSSASRTESLDLILCRNVLIYFSGDQFARTVSRLARCLRPGGWLVVSAVEAPQVKDPLLQPRRFGAVTVFERRAEGSQPRERAATTGLTERKTEPVVVPARSAAERRPARAAQPALPVRPPAEDPLVLARAAAAAGQFVPALQHAERAAVARRLDPAAHYLIGILQQEIGNWPAAEAALRRVLFLEPRHAAAQVALGHILTRRRRWADARRQFQNALAVAVTLPPDQPVPELDLNGGALSRLLRTLLETQPASPSS